MAKKRIKNKKYSREVLPERSINSFMHFYRIGGIVMIALLFVMLLITVLYLPEIGAASNPDNNEVAERYIESGLEETGAVNIVSGMILDYRAFDTFGESCVLFIATICVTIMLRIDSREKGTSAEESDDRHYEPRHDVIFQKCAKVIIPVVMVFGIYIILNGHLSPGGGFSGGAILGAGLILYINAYGFTKTERFMTAKLIKLVTFFSLLVYCLAKSYSFFTGANHIESMIPLGTPGAILSSGLILVLNICVGLVVACTMYSFYALMRRGRI